MMVICQPLRHENNLAKSRAATTTGANVSQAVITGTGLHTPGEAVSNEELVEAFNKYVDNYNHANADAIKRGTIEVLEYSDADFIYKASGIRSRYVVEKSGVLDPERMRPCLRTRGNDEPSLLCEMALDASRQALSNAGRESNDVDAVIAACTAMPRPYPSLAVELQHYLGAQGFGFDMTVACATAAFGIQTAVDMIANGSARRVLMVNPEVASAHLNFCDRDSHFIFGDVCTAALLEATDDVGQGGFEVVSTQLKTQFSNNIRNNFGFLNRSEMTQREWSDCLFVQNGRRVFKEVGPLVAGTIIEHIEREEISADQLSRLWLHQANCNLNSLIARRVLGREADETVTPMVLDEYANTSSASPIIVFHKYRNSLQSGEIGVLVGYGAGYSVGSVILRRL